MPLVPEKLNSRQEVRNAIASQFWDQPVQSGRSVDGTARTHACEPPPAGQTAAGGLLRSQELLITQAAGLPLMPGFSEDKGGVVLDRVIAKVGGKRWWANLSGRANGQQMWTAHRAGSTVGDALKNLNSYSLSARTHFAPSRNTSVNAVVEAPNVHNLHDLAKESSSRGAKRRRAAHSKPALKSQAWAKYQLPGHHLVGTAACNQDYLDSAANYSTVPLSVSLDLASKDRPDGIQYRVGMHQVSAPEVDNARFQSFEEAMPSDSSQWRTSLHAQGAVAVEGEGYLWRPGRRAAAAAAPASATSDSAKHTSEAQASSQDATADADDSKAQASQDSAARSSDDASSTQTELGSGSALASGGAASEPGHVQKGRHSSAVVSPAEQTLARQPKPIAAHSYPQPSSALPSSAHQMPAAQSRATPSEANGRAGAPHHSADHPRSSVPSPPSSTAQPPLPTAVSASPGQPSMSAAAVSDRTDQSKAASSQSADSSALPPASNTARQHTTASLQPQRPWPLVRRRRADGSEGVLLDNYSTVVSDSDSSDDDLQPEPRRLLGDVSAKQIQSSISQAQSNVVKLRQVLDAVTTGIQEGRAQQQHQRQLALSRQSRPVPYSPWLSQPFLKVNAAVGCLARMPLPQSAFRPLYTSNPASFTADKRAGRTSSRFGSELWTPYLRDTALRVFGSVGVTGQLGHFSRRVLDFTAGSVRLDFGLTSPHHINSTAAASSYGNLSVFNPRDDHLDAADLDEPAASQPLSTARFKNRAFALEGRGIWHALSASITQQVLGPVRARADFRYALDLPSNIPQGPDGKRSWHNILEAAGQTKPTLLETVYGLDVIIPGTSGVARAALWYSPVRKEGMVELKLF